jgi:uncharacterized membrane protein (GlpM family)
MIIVIKIVVTSLMVLGLSWLSERISPRVAGVFAGLPLGIAVSLFFIGVEQGPSFAAEASLSALGGLGASVIFCFAYWRFSATLRRWNIALTSVLSLAVFLVAAALIGFLPQNRWLLKIVTLVITAVALFVFRRISEADPAQRKQVTVTPLILLVRAALATAIVLAITGLASVIGEKWSGLLSGFPITLYPVLLIVHATYSEGEAHGIIQAFPYGVGSLIICAFAGSYLLVQLGVYWGMALSILLAAIYLAVVGWAVWKKGARSAGPLPKS